MLAAPRSAVSFLSIVPVGGDLTPFTPAFFFLPGLLIGAVSGLAWVGAARGVSPLVGAVLAVLVEAVGTRGLHFDGLSDVGDALFVHGVTRTRRLEIMSDPRAGALGVLSLVCAVLLRVALLAHLHPSVLLLAGLGGCSRTALAIGLVWFPRAKPGGLTALFVRGAHPLKSATIIACGLVLSVGCLMTTLAVSTALLSGVVAVGGALVVQWCLSRILGGVTGDVLGASSVVGELLGLAAAGVAL